MIEIRVHLSQNNTQSDEISGSLLKKNHRTNTITTNKKQQYKSIGGQEIHIMIKQGM